MDRLYFADEGILIETWTISQVFVPTDVVAGSMIRWFLRCSSLIVIANSDRRVIAIPNNVSLIFLVNMARFDFFMINEDL